MKIYDSKWQTFVKWCSKENKGEPTQASPPIVAEFLDHLFSDKKRSVSTIAGYRSSINKVLSVSTGPEVKQDPTLSDLMAHFWLERPRSTRTVPEWDLALVLKFLKKHPFEPMGSAELKFVTWKTAFLLLLALGGRRGEVHALEASTIRIVDNWNSVVLNPNPTFLAKTQDLTNNKRRFKDVVINSLKEITGGDRDLDYDLCPVRALRFYLDRTKSRRGNIKPLFLTYKAGQAKPACPNTLSAWIKQLIRLAYERTANDNDSLRLLRARAHEVRAISTSMALFGNVAIEDILDQCRWTSSTTFTTHYLRDMTDTSQRVRSLLPINVAGKMLRSKDPRSPRK